MEPTRPVRVPPRSERTRPQRRPPRLTLGSKSKPLTDLLPTFQLGSEHSGKFRSLAPKSLKLCGRISSPAQRLKSGSWLAGRGDSSTADRIPANPESVFRLRGSAMGRSP